MPEVSRILVVDDDPDSLSTLSAVLSDEGYEVIEATDGVHAVEAVENDSSIDLVLSDVRMPIMDGVEALARIKKLRPHIPVILATAYTMADVETRAFDEGAYTVFRKPLNLGDVLRVIGRALRAPLLVVVDGVTEDREEILHALEARRHRAVAVADAEAALEALRTAVVDVVVLGVSDDADGVAQLETLRRGDASVPIVLVTRGAGRQLLDAAGRLGIAAWLPRPIDPSKLARLLAEVRAAARTER